MNHTCFLRTAVLALGGLLFCACPGKRPSGSPGFGTPSEPGVTVPWRFFVGMLPGTSVRGESVLR